MYFWRPQCTLVLSVYDIVYCIFLHFSYVLRVWCFISHRDFLLLSNKSCHLHWAFAIRSSDKPQQAQAVAVTSDTLQLHQDVHFLRVPSVVSAGTSTVSFLQWLELLWGRNFALHRGLHTMGPTICLLNEGVGLLQDFEEEEPSWWSCPAVIVQTGISKAVRKQGAVWEVELSLRKQSPAGT